MYIGSSDNDKTVIVTRITLGLANFPVKFPSRVSPSEGNVLTVDVTLAFQGHYGEPEITIKHVVSKLGSTIFMLKFDVATGEWKIENK